MGGAFDSLKIGDTKSHMGTGTDIESEAKPKRGESGAKRYLRASKAVVDTIGGAILGISGAGGSAGSAAGSAAGSTGAAAGAASSSPTPTPTPTPTPDLGVAGTGIKGSHNAAMGGPSTNPNLNNSFVSQVSKQQPGLSNAAAGPGMFEQARALLRGTSDPALSTSPSPGGPGANPNLNTSLVSDVLNQKGGNILSKGVNAVLDATGLPIQKTHIPRQIFSPDGKVVSLLNSASRGGGAPSGRSFAEDEVLRLLGRGQR